MLRACVLSLAACIASFGIGVAEERAKPRGPGPQFMVVTEVSRDGITLEHRTPGRAKAGLVRERVYELGFADFQTLDAAGKELTQEQFRQRAAVEPVVLVFAEKVEPAYCRIVRPEAV